MHLQIDYLYLILTWVTNQLHHHVTLTFMCRCLVRWGGVREASLWESALGLHHRSRGHVWTEHLLRLHEDHEIHLSAEHSRSVRREHTFKRTRSPQPNALRLSPQELIWAWRYPSWRWSAQTSSTPLCRGPSLWRITFPRCTRMTRRGRMTPRSSSSSGPPL